ncbi:MAG: hypothetical protein V4857_00865 [Pseudomonadota bacterium]
MNQSTMRRRVKLSLVNDSPAKQPHPNQAHANQPQPNQAHANQPHPNQPRGDRSQTKPTHAKLSLASRHAAPSARGMAAARAAPPRACA